MNDRVSLTKDEVTYERFELNPAEYYENRFAHTPVKTVVGKESLATKQTIIFQKSAALHEALHNFIAERGNNETIKVLEIGCGSGTIGARLKAYVPHIELYGVDMSATCIEVAKQNDFDHVIAYDVVTSLPYESNYFDFVYTMDFFGHVEFRSKDQIIAEIHRVTKPGGQGFHGIEMGYVNYMNCNPKDPDDIVRKYVYMEGHIGIETLDDILMRFNPHFDIIGAYPWPIRPMLNINNILTSEFWGKEFCEAFAEIDSFNSRQAADMVIQHCSQYLLNSLRDIYGNILTPASVAKSGNSKLDAWIEYLIQGSGFAKITTRKR
ncbi:class I SAM-dependent methyltransferase [Paenibacillus sp. N1-5-1-14]|uniref:class I SAM-dependent methyltransferase n=1 Tax=Paenibacillus radicibacter TaxID=2972488 RepID=UPI002158C823|nr:class I SAM-dependent methyltransferase [Paenibacillus radicibacter]MCR8644690.1 class I SAM-dependent methyltransferase [Paenibacillus radicibacter]